MYLRRTVIVCAYVLALAGCSKPHDKTIPSDPDTWKENAELKEAIAKLPEEEKDLLKGWMLRHAMGTAFGATIPETTVGDAITQQREFAEKRAAKEAEEKALAEKVARQRAEAEARMNAVLTFAMTRLEFQDGDLLRGRHDGFEVEFAFQNKSDKDLAGVKGTVHFADMFDDTIKSVGLSMDEPVKAGATATWGGTLDYNQFMAADKKLRSTARDKLKVSFVPEVYLFADGSKMTMPE